MRFRATIINVVTFLRTVQAVEKLQKKCLIKFTETSMHIICTADADDGVQVWSQIKIASLFENYRIQSNSDNVITMAIPCEALLSALRSASATTTTAGFEPDEVIVKLAKKNDQAMLSFDISGNSRAGFRQKVIQDIKIEVMRPADVEKFSEPLCPDPDVHLVLPALHKLRTITERLRPLSEVLAFKANNNKKLSLGIHTDAVRVETEWTDCHIARPNEEPPPDPDKFYTVLISSRSFLRFLNSHLVSTTTIACVCHQHCLILYVYIGDPADAGGVLTFYIPSIVDDEG